MSAVAYVFGKQHLEDIRKLISLDHRKKESWCESLSHVLAGPSWTVQTALGRKVPPVWESVFFSAALANFFFFFKLKWGIRRKSRIYLLHCMHFSTRYCLMKTDTIKTRCLEIYCFLPTNKKLSDDKWKYLSNCNNVSRFFPTKISPQWGTAIRKQL